MLKKIVLISSIVLSGLALIASIYFLFFRESEPVFQPSPAPAVVQTPAVIDQNIVFVSRTPYLSATLSPDSRKIRYFDQSTQSFIEVEFSGLNPIKLLDAELKNISDIIWSPDKSKVIAVLNEKGVKRYRFIDLNSGEKIAYPPERKSPIFSPTSNKIVYNFLDPAKNINKIEIADISGKNWQEVSKIRIQDLVLQWPQNGKLALSFLSSALNPSSLFLLDIADGGLIKVIPESFGLEILWSPKGDKIIYSSVDKNGQGPMLKIASVPDRETKDLKVATFAKKCAWSADNRTIFCAVPFEWPTAKLTLPDDYHRRIFYTSDQIIKINPESGEETMVFSPSENLPDIQNIFLGSGEEYLFFTNKKDGLFYAIKL